MEQSASPTPATQSEIPAAGSPPGSPVPPEVQAPEAAATADGPRKKKPRKKRKTEEASDAPAADGPAVRKPVKKKKRKEGKTGKDEEGAARKKARKQARKAQLAAAGGNEELSAAQLAVNEQMRKALEKDEYSALGSIVDTESEDEGTPYRKEGLVRLDRSTILSAMRKRLWMEKMNSSGSTVVYSQDDDESDAADLASRGSRPGRKKKRKKGKRSKEEEASMTAQPPGSDIEAATDAVSEVMSVDEPVPDVIHDRDEGSIFGATTGSSNATWVECDKCKKWRRLRGVVDEKKLPSKWYCSMNKNDPERSRCSAPEEEYETPNTPESAADARTRKHLRIWVRRLQCNEAYESRQPTMTRGKKRSAITSCKDPYEWVRCCSCGKWRALLRCMDAKTHVLDRVTNGEWYCVMNTWDEKTASCAAPQENLPALGCPPWVMQDM